MADSELAFGRNVFSLPLLWLMVFVKGIPAVGPEIIPVYLIGVPLEFAALMLYVHALRISPLSLTVPYLSLTPAFLLLTGPLTGEIPGIPGMLGVLMIVAGGFLLNRGKSGADGSPLKKPALEKGSLMMTGVAMIYTVTSTAGKMGVLLSDPLFFAASNCTLLLLPLTVWTVKRGNFRNLFSRGNLMIGLAYALSIAFHMMALETARVSYMISLKRSSLLWGIIFGAVFFREDNFTGRMRAGLLMAGGMIIIALFG